MEFAYSIKIYQKYGQISFVTYALLHNHTHKAESFQFTLIHLFRIQGDSVFGQYLG